MPMCQCRFRPFLCEGQDKESISSPKLKRDRVSSTNTMINELKQQNFSEQFSDVIFRIPYNRYIRMFKFPRKIRHNVLRLLLIDHYEEVFPFM